MAEPLNMDLQYFAENPDNSETSDTETDSTTTSEQEQNTETEETESTETTEKTFTQADVDKIIEQRVARERKISEKKTEEAKKLAKMNSDQKKEYELEKAKQEAKDTKTELARYQMRGEARSQLAEKGLSDITEADLDLIVTSEAESTSTNVSNLVAFAERVREAQRKEDFKGTPPTVGTKRNNLTLPDAKAFNAMPFEEKAEVLKNNPNALNQITGGK